MTSLLDPDRDTAGTSLTRAQELLWVTHELHPDSPLYSQGFLFTIDGRLDIAYLTRAFALLVSQSESLRTVIEEREGIPRQRVLPAIEFDIPILDFSRSDDPLEAFSTWVTERRVASVDLDERTFDAAIAQLRNKTGFYFSHHHLVADATSAEIHFRRLSEIYEAVAEGSSGQLPPLPPFRDFAKFEVTQRSGPPEPTGGPPGIRTPLYGHSERALTTDSERVEVDLGEDRWERIVAAATEPGMMSITPQLSMFRLFLTAYVAFVYLVSGETTVTLGTLSHNRSSRRFRETPGLFTEMFPLSVDLASQETFRSLYDRVVQVSDDFLRGARPGASSPVANKGISNVLNYLTTTFVEFAGHHVKTRWMHTGHVEPEHLFVLHVTQFNPKSSPQVLFDLNTSTFVRSIRRRIPLHFLSVLDGMLSDLDMRIDDVEILTDSERDALNRVNYGIGTSSPSLSVIELFERQARRQPQRIALSDGDSEISFARLLELVDLASTNLPTGVRVAIDLPRSIESVVLMLAVLRAGSTFIIIDRSWPSNRIEEVVSDSGATLVVGTGATYDSVQSLPFSEVTRASADVRHPAGGPADVAYVLYTSGSTGRPKGVMISHRSLSNYVTWARGFYDRDRSLDFPLFTPLTFDLTITSIFVPLTAGGTIRVYSESRQPADLSVQEVFLDNATDIVKLTPSHLGLLEGLDLSDSRVGQLILGGEELTVSAARRISERIPGVVIHNEYGPTEATVGCMIHTYDPTSDQGLTVPIGKPIAAMRCYVVGRSGKRVPVGVPGELVLAGEGLADGYLNRSAETAARFEANVSLGEAKTYSSGDRARVLPDGSIQYLGRLDEQVKVKGMRIELGEVEAAIASHPLVASAAARVNRTDEQGSNRELAGYFVSSGSLSPKEVKRHVEEILPAPMVPKTFTQIPAVPLTSHAKVDRNALPSPGPHESASTASYVAPRSKIESDLILVWEEVLRTDQIGIRDSFFELGGDSISAIKVTARARQLGVDVSLRQFFDSPTVEGIAALAEDSRAKPGMGRRARKAPEPSSTDLERLVGMLEQRDRRTT